MTERQKVLLTEVALRDGSHALSHQYTVQQVEKIAKGLNEAKVPYIEVAHGDGLAGSSLQYGRSKTNEFELIEAEPDYYGEVAKKYLYKGSSTYVGFITSVTESFCSSCTRSRISADGKLYTCLFNGNGHDLKSFIRNGAADEELLNYIKSIWQARADRYSDLRTAEAKGSNSKIEMSYIGG